MSGRLTTLSFNWFSVTRNIIMCAITCMFLHNSIFYSSRQTSTRPTDATAPEYQSCWHHRSSTRVFRTQYRARSQKRRKGRSLVDTSSGGVVWIGGWGDRFKDQAGIFFDIITQKFSPLRARPWVPVHMSKSPANSTGNPPQKQADAPVVTLCINGFRFTFKDQTL
jgi:hypothetical protein